MVNPLLTGTTAIRANQAGLDTVAQNIANANTPGYHRQQVRLSTTLPLQGESGLLFGQGVVVDGVQQIRSDFLELALAANKSETSATTAELGVIRQIESLLIPDEGSVSARLQDFFSSLEKLSASPTDASVQQSTVRQAQALTGSFNRIAGDLQSLASGLRAEIEETVTQINNLAVQLSDRNQQLRATGPDTGERATLLDQRDQIVGELAALIDVELRTEGFGRTVALVGNGTALIGQQPAQFELLHRDGELVIVQPGPDTDIDVVGGRLAGLLDAHNRIIPGFLERLDDLARGVVHIIDSVHAEGVGAGGAFQQLIAQRKVDRIDVPLNQSGIELPIEAGRLFVTVTDTATGQTRRQSIAIDPNTQSLADVIGNLDQLEHVNASAVGDPAQVRISADSGHELEFTGRADFTVTSIPTFTGSSTVKFNGRFSGDSNSTLTLRVRESGTVGVTPDLAVEVFDESGDLVTTVNIGEGYEAGAGIAIAAGVTVSFGSGVVNQSDALSIDLIGDPDETGILAALGLNSLFTGTTAADLALNESIRLDPSQLAGSLSGQDGDTSNLLRLIDEINNGQVGDSGLSPVEFLAQIVADSGHHVNDLETLSQHLEAYGSSLAADQQSLSGVNPDEELLRLLQFQRGYQAAAQLLVTVERTLDDLFLILR